MKVKIGEKIKELRKRDDITQEELAAALGVTNQAVSKWENENGYPDIEYISPIADFFKVTTDYLFDHVQKGRYKILDLNGLETNRKFLSDLLGNNYTVIIGDSLDCVANEQPDLIIMDIYKQDKSIYFEYLTILKNSEITRSIPVIVIIGYNENESEIAPKFLNLGAADYIVKPCTVEELKARITVQLRNVK